MTTVDFTALTTAPSRDEVRAYRRTNPGGGTATAVGLILVAVFAGVIGLVVLSGVVVSAVLSLRDVVSGNGRPILLVVQLVFPAIVLTVLITAFVAAVRGFIGRGARHARMSAFAAANGMTFVPSISDPGGPGMIFGLGHSKVAVEVFELGPQWLDRPVRIGSYRYTTGSGKQRRTHDWGFLSLKLDRRLPHMVLDAAGNDASLFGRRLSNLPVGLDPEQRLSLEGDFDRYFTLYAPRDYERDALYVFTPDLMALLIDAVSGNGPGGRGASYDVEIVDDTLYLYSSRPLDLLQPAVWTRLLAIVKTVGAKTLRQTTRYADERVPDRAVNIVAEPGRRLKRRVPVLFLVIVGLGVAWFLAQDVLAALLGW